MKLSWVADDMFKISMNSDFDVNDSVSEQCDNMFKYLILIMSVSLLITFVGGSFSVRNLSSVEVNETIVNSKSFHTKTMEMNKEAALEQRLADVL